jgi:hypothetical protein
MIASKMSRRCRSGCGMPVIPCANAHGYKDFGATRLSAEEYFVIYFDAVALIFFFQSLVISKTLFTFAPSNKDKHKQMKSISTYGLLLNIIILLHRTS